MTTDTFTLDPIDAATAGFMFAEITGGASCFPAEFLRYACEGEQLPTDGKSDRRFSGLRRHAPIVCADDWPDHADMTQSELDALWWLRKMVA
jgi:hypothetical protein